MSFFSRLLLVRFLALAWLLCSAGVAGAAALPHAGREVLVDWNARFVEPAGPSGTVGTFAVWDDGGGEALYAGADNNSTTGAFNTAGGNAMNWIGRWNGVSWSALGSGLNGPVSSMVAFGDELVVAGGFTMAGDVPVSGIARWNGQRWEGFVSNLRHVSSLVAACTRTTASSPRRSRAGRGAIGRSSAVASIRLSKLVSKLDDTDFALGADAMHVATRGYSLLKVVGRYEGLEEFPQGSQCPLH